MVLLFAIGVGLGFVERSRWRIGPVAKPLPLILAIFTVAIALLYALEIPTRKPLWLEILVWLPSVVAVQIAVSGEQRSRSWGEPIAIALGEASYSTYLFHLFVLGAIGKLFDRFVPSVSLGLAFVLFGIVSANLVGFLVFRFLERPTTRSLMSIGRRVPLRSTPNQAVQGEPRPGDA